MKRSHGFTSRRRGENHKIPFYGVWQSMKQRCLNPNASGYRHYGGRGISIYPEWMEFEKFKEDMLPSYRQGLWLERKDNDQGYSKENCRWATFKDQCNNKRTSHLIEHNGKRLSVTKWSEETGISRRAIYKRVELGWPVERLLSEPVNQNYVRQ